MIDKTQQIPETLFDINPSEFPIALEDIILVSNPYDMEALQKLPNVHQFQITLEEIEMLSGIGQERHLTSTQSLIPETNLPSGAVYELAFLNQKRNKYIMVREFRDKKIHNLNEAHKILHLNEIIENPFKGNLLFFKVSELEVAGGINLDRLIFENRQIIVKQLAYLKYKKPSLIHAQNVLKKSQEIYRNF